MKLYELEQQYLILLEKIKNEEIDNDYLYDTLESLEGDIEAKIDNTACIVKQLQSEATALKDESNKLIERAINKQKKAEYLLKYIEATMIKININKIETSKNLIQIKKNPTSVVIDNGFIDWAKIEQPALIRIKTIEEADKLAIKEFLKSNELKYARLEQKEKLVIK